MNVLKYVMSILVVLSVSLLGLSLAAAEDSATSHSADCSKDVSVGPSATPGHTSIYVVGDGAVKAWVKAKRVQHAKQPWLKVDKVLDLAHSGQVCGSDVVWQHDFGPCKKLKLRGDAKSGEWNKTIRCYKAPSEPKDTSSDCHKIDITPVGGTDEGAFWVDVTTNTVKPVGKIGSQYIDFSNYEALPSDADERKAGCTNVWRARVEVPTDCKKAVIKVATEVWDGKKKFKCVPQ